MSSLEAKSGEWPFIITSSRFVFVNLIYWFGNFCRSISRFGQFDLLASTFFIETILDLILLNFHLSKLLKAFFGTYLNLWKLLVIECFFPLLTGFSHLDFAIIFRRGIGNTYMWCAWLMEGKYELWSGLIDFYLS